MKMGSVRAGALLVGAAFACAAPAVAWGQLDPNKVGGTVNGVQQQVPKAVPQVQVPSVQVPKAPATAAPRSSAPSSSSGGGGGGSSSGGGSSHARSAPSSSGGGSSQASGSSSSSSSGSSTAHASSSKGHKAAAKHHSSSAVHASSRKQASSSKRTASAGADVGNQVRPATGTGGDSRLPFTGYALIAIAALGLIALIGGGGLRLMARMRPARRRA